MKWIISELFYPDEVSTALIMTEIAERFAESAPVSIICGPTGYEKTYKQQDKSLNENIKIYRVKILNLDKNKIVSRIIRLVLLTFKMTFKLILKVRKGDEVLMVTNPAFLLITVAFLKPIKKIKLSILFHDVFPDNLIPAGLIKRDSLKFRLLDRLFSWAYKRADNLIVLGEDMQELLEKKLSIDKARIPVITNWCDPSIFPIPDFSPSQYFDIDFTNKIVIGFAGNIGRVQGIPEFIKAFIAASNDYLVLVLIGDGAMKNEIQSGLDNKNIIFAGARPRSEQIDFLNACDVSLITLKEGMKGLGVPSKTYNVMAVGKPILYIGDKDSEVDRYIGRFNNGWCFNWHEREQLINFLGGLTTNNLSEIKIKGNNSLKAVRQNFQKDNILKRFELINNE
jgi:glycosyltransferase involved in cell wall biosynthesis